MTACAALSNAIGQQPETVPVLAMGCHLTLVGVTRILGRDGIPLHILCEETDFARSSRWYCGPPEDKAAAKPDQLEIFLHSLALEQAVLMPCSDDWLRAVADLPPRVRRRFPSSMPERDVIHTMIDKWRFRQLLESTGTPHPETRLISSRDELENLPDRCFHSSILKPISSIDFARKHEVKGYLVGSRAEALSASRDIEFPIMLQEFIPGPPTANVFIEGFVDRHGRICAELARQRLRMYPAKLGNSTLSKTIKLSDVGGAVEIIDRLFRAIRYRGIFSAEFKYDRRDDRFKILEVNARPWWYIEFAARCGIDFCRLAYHDALQLHIEPVREYEVGRRCVLLSNDLLAYFGTCKDRSASLRSWVRSVAGADGALFAWDDMRPGIVSGLNSASSAITKRIRKHLPRRISTSVYPA